MGRYVCRDDNCETCHPENEDLPSNFCRFGAFCCPYRNGATVCTDEDFCKGCKYAYTKKEWRLLNTPTPEKKDSQA